MTKTFDDLATEESITKTVAALEANGFHAEVVGSGAEALAKIKEIIPQGASVHNGSSKTLEEIGFIDYLKSGAHGWNNLHAAILAETDINKQTQLRRESVFSDYYLGSVHALSETGELVIASNTGSQLPHLVFTSPNIILVVGTQKITATLSEAIERLEQYVVPLEDGRIFGLHNVHTMLSKTLILHKENKFMKRNIKIILVKEKLGF